MSASNASPLLIGQISLFQIMSKEDRSRIAGSLRVRHFSKNQLILARHDVTNDVYFICSGRVRVTSFSVSGKEASYNEKKAGELFGELSAIDDLARAADVIALQETTTLHMSQTDFKQLLRDYPLTNQRLMELLVMNVRSLTERVFEFTAMDVRARIISELHRMCVVSIGSDEGLRANSILLDPAPKHADLASRVSTTREAVTREINALSEAGFIDKQGPRRLFINSISDLGKLIKI